MPDKPDEATIEKVWRDVLEGRMEPLMRSRNLFRWLPSEPRCRICNAPFGGIGGPIMSKFLNRRPSGLSPRFCTMCEQLAEQYPGGTEIEITMLFADVRGSTTIAEQMSPTDFRRLLNRFYKAVTDVLVPADAWIDKLVGDEVIGLFIPGFVGPDHARKAIHVGQHLLRAVGYGSGKEPWIPIGIGIHTDTVYVGRVGTEDKNDITALGDGMNTTARLVSSAAAGEMLVSEAACLAANIPHENCEERDLELKGKAERVKVRVFHADSLQPA